MNDGDRRLLLVLLDSDAHVNAAEATLRRLAGADHVLRIAPAAFVAYVGAPPSAVRDGLRADRPPGSSAFVVEFERWSSAGDAIDRTWLLAHGH